MAIDESLEQEIDQELDNMSAEEDFDEAFDDAVAEFDDLNHPEDDVEEPAKPKKKAAEAKTDVKDEFEVEKYLADKQKNATEAQQDAPPVGWSEHKPELMEAWKSIPAEVKAEIRKRDEDVRRFLSHKTNELDNLQKQAAPLAQVTRECMPLIEEWGLEEKPLSMEEAVRQSIVLRQYIKKTDNLTLAKQFMRAAGATPADMEDHPQEARDREIQSLREELNQFKMKSESSQQTSAQQAEEAKRQAFSTHVAQRYYAFAETLNVNGEPKYPSARINGFADAMGSQIARRVQQFPGTPIDEHIK